MHSKYSAGILLYRIHNGETQFLLGKDIKYNSWSDFGGKCDSADNNRPLQTAIREFYEETCGVLANMHEMTSLIHKKYVKIHCSSYKKKMYYMFLVKYDKQYLDIENIFKDQYMFLKQTNVCMKFKEKKEIKWFSLDYICNNKSMLRGVFYNSFVNNIETIKRVTT